MNRISVPVLRSSLYRRGNNLMVSISQRQLAITKPVHLGSLSDAGSSRYCV
jgi:hypothetical protein